MPRSGPLARLAAPLVLVSLWTPTTAALPAPHASAAATAPRVADVDSDGDGVGDTGDGCPLVFAMTSTGCPTASRTASLRWLEAAHRLEARIASPVTACAARARLVLWRVRPSRDVKVLGAIASSRGRYRFTVPRGAGYFVTVSPSYASGRAECAKAASRIVRVPRG